MPELSPAGLPPQLFQSGAGASGFQQTGITGALPSTWNTTPANGGSTPFVLVRFA